MQLDTSHTTSVHCSWHVHARAVVPFLTNRQLSKQLEAYPGYVVIHDMHYVCDLGGKRSLSIRLHLAEILVDCCYRFGH